MSITLTEKAAVAVKQEMDKFLQASGDPEKRLYLRISVKGGGCSGFQNKLDLDERMNEKTDEVFEFHGVPVVVDRRSLVYLEGARVDYHDEDMNRRGFSIQNPNAKGTCGCGSSYSM